MKIFQTFALVAGAIVAVSAAATPDPEAKAVVGEFEYNGANYIGEISSAKAARDEGDVLNARCSGTRLIGSDCDPGKCECYGQAGCYSCNGKPYRCQKTNSAGKPTSCY